VPCLIALLALISPRLALIVTWLVNDILSRSFDSWVLPLIGFFILPWATLAYAWFWKWGPGTEVTGWEWIVVVVAVLIDLGSFGGARRKRD
jgi:hypothetical protein